MNQNESQPKTITRSALQELAKTDLAVLEQASILALSDLIDLKRGNTESGLPENSIELRKIAIGLGFTQAELDAACMKTYATQKGYDLIVQ